MISVDDRLIAWIWYGHVWLEMASEVLPFTRCVLEFYLILKIDARKISDFAVFEMEWDKNKSTSRQQT